MASSGRRRTHFYFAPYLNAPTFEKPIEPSVGVLYLVVGGTVVVDEGKIVPDVFPDRALLGTGKRSASRIVG